MIWMLLTVCVLLVGIIVWRVGRPVPATPKPLPTSFNTCAFRLASVPSLATHVHSRAKTLEEPQRIEGDMPDGSNSCEGRERGWMQTYSGRKFYPLAPLVDDIELMDVVHGLAMTCRYGGQCRRFYSVAEHCLIVSSLVEQHARNAGMAEPEVRALAREALMHDSSEAYIGDMIRPLKHQPEMIEFRRAEAAIETAIFAKFGIVSTHESHAIIKTIDNRILVDEISQLMPLPEMYLESPLLAEESPFGVKLACWEPQRAQEQFMARYRELFT